MNIRILLFSCIFLICFRPLHAQTYCTPTAVNLANYGVGVVNFTMGSINNNSSYYPFSNLYTDNTFYSTSSTAGSSVSLSVKLGPGNSTKVHVYIDWDKDGYFYGINELVWSNTNTTAGSTQGGSFNVPSVSPGVYRIRVASDGGTYTPDPCSITWSGDFEDYLFVVRATSGTDAMAYKVTSPAGNYQQGNNTMAVRWFNLGASSITSANLSYRFNNGSVVTQAFSGSLAAGAGMTTTFSTALNLSTVGTYPVKIYTASPNATSPDAIRANDTISQNVFVCGAMSGTYTIDSAQATAGNNFKTFTEAINAMVCGSVSGPVVFNVGAGTYAEQISIPPITGASATNTITFNGGSGNASTRTITYNFPGTPSNCGVVTLNGADYIRLKNLTIRSTSTIYGYGVLLTGGADNNIVDSCIINLSSITFNGTANYSAGINFSGASNNTGTDGSNSNGNIIRNSEIKGAANGGPYRGINLYGQCASNSFINNTITDFYEAGIMVTFITAGTVIKNNNISRPNRTSAPTNLFGISLQNGHSSFLVEGNKIFNPNGGMTGTTKDFYGIHSYSNTGSGNSIRNNAIYNINGMGDNYGIYDSYCGAIVSTSIDNNTISLDLATAKSNTKADYGIYIYFYHLTAGFTKSIRNNVITLRRNGSSSSAVRCGLTFYDEGNPESDRNLILTAATTGNNVAVLYNGTNYSSLDAWKASNGLKYDQNSVSMDPQYVSITTNVTPSNCGLNNRGALISSNPYDLSGATRGNYPDIGAYEFGNAGANDAAISGIVNNVLCSGTQPVQVKLKNYGNNNLSSAIIKWNINGTAQSDYSWNGTLAPNAETNVNIGSGSFPSSNISLKAYTSSPNGSSDVCPANDTSSFVATSGGMTGSYTINPSGSGSTNFTTFAAAVAALDQRGVCGPVVFNVSAATYYEQLILTPVRGASSVNTITFNGGAGNASSCILQAFTTGMTGYAGVDINGGDYFIIRNLSMKPAASGMTTNYYGVLLRNNADNNIIDSCLINLSVITSVAANSAGILMSSSNTAMSGGNQGANNTFRGNQITGSANGGAFYGIALYGNGGGNSSANDNTRVIGNTIKDFYDSGIFLSSIKNCLVSANDISRPARTSTTYLTYGINASFGDFNVYEKNRIYNPYGGAGSNTNQFNCIALLGSSSNNPVTIANNVMYNLTGLGAMYGIWTQYENAVRIVHNTISNDNTAVSSSSTDIGIYVDQSMNVFTPAYIRNNIITMTRGGSGGRYGLYLSQGYFSSDYNIFYLTGTAAYIGALSGAGSHSTLASWRSASSQDAGSVSLNPNYSNAASGNFMPTNSSANNTGNAVSMATTDINGVLRHPGNPDAGAYEWGPSCTGTPIAFGVSLNNNGSAACASGTIVSLTAGYNAQAGLTFQWQSSSNGSSFSNVSGATSNTYSTTAGSFLHYQCIVTCAATANADTTSALLVTTGLSGTYTINPAGSGTNNFTSFMTAVNALHAHGVCGPVIFNAAPGTYNGRFTLNAVTGASATNTITFDGIIADSVIISESFSTTPTNVSIVDLNGADYIRVRNIKVKTASTTYGWGFLLRNMADHNIIENCIVDMSAATSTAAANVMGIVLGGETSNFSVPGNHANDLLVQNNVVKGGTNGGPYYAISVQASQKLNENLNIRFLNNNLLDFYSIGFILFNYAPGLIVKGNNISRPSRTNTGTCYGIFSNAGVGRRIEGNTIFNTFGGTPNSTDIFYGIWQSSDANSDFDSCVTANNLMYGNYSKGTMTGIYNNSAPYVSYSHNTIVFDTNATNTTNTSTIYGFQSSGSTNNVFPLDFKNNIIHITRPGGTRYGIYLSNNPYYVASDHNNIYVNGNGSSNYTGYLPSTNYSSLSNWQAMGYDANSFNLNAQFTSAGDFTPTNASLNNAGNPSLYIPVTKDLRGNDRKAGAPDLGCIEWTPPCTGSGISAGSTFKGTMRSGTLSDFDHLKAKDTITYQITPPAGFNNAAYTSSWIITDLSFSRLNGGAPASADTAIIDPSSAGNGTIRFSPSNLYTDSTFRMKFTVRSILGSECASTYERYIFVAPVPLVNFDSTISSCYGDSLTMINNSSISSGTMVHAWNFGDAGNNTSGLKNPAHLYTTAGNFNVKLKSTSNLGYSDSLTAVIRIAYLPQPNFTFSNVCNGQGVNFSNTSAISGPTATLGYTWTFGDASGSTSTSPSKTYASTGTYSVKLIAVSSIKGCKDSISKNVTVYPMPSVSFTSNIANQCVNGNSYSFTNTSSISSGSLSYAWNYGDANTATSTNGSNIYSTSGSFNVKLVATSNNGCKDSSTQSMTVYPKPSVGFTINNANQCVNTNSYTFTNTSGISSGSMTHAWKYGDGNTATSANGSNTYSTVNTFSVKLISTSNYGCKDSTAQNVTVYPKPSVSFTANNAAQCRNGNSFSFTNGSSISSGSLSYAWNYGNNTTASTTNGSVTYSSQGSYNVKLVATSNNGCKDSSTQSMTVYPSPTVSFTTNNAAQCVNGNEFIFTNTSSGIILNIWDFGDGNSSVQTSDTNTYNAAGTYTVKLYAASVYCLDSAQQTVTVHPKPSVGFTTNNSGQCVNGNSFSFTNASSISSGTMTYAWNYGDGNNATTTHGSNIYGTAGTYNVKLLATSNNGCKDSSTQSMSVYPKPSAGFTINDTAQCVNTNSFAFSNSSSISSGNMTHLWNYGDGNTGSNTNGSRTYASAGSFSVKLISTSNNGCKDSTSKNIKVHPKPSVSFTVNDSGQCLGKPGIDLNNFVFANTSSIPGGSMTHDWTYGYSGAYSSSLNGFHLYQEAGSFSVQLLSTSDKGCKDSVSMNVSVHPQPQVGFTNLNTAQCLNGNSFAFDDTTQLSSGTYTRRWEFGDGNISSVGGLHHAYASAGTYPATLYITTDHGCTDSLLRQMTVWSSPVAGFSVNDSTQCLKGNNFAFNNNSTITGGGLNYVWDLGDGSIDSANNMNHSYDTAGNYTTMLIATGAHGCNDTADLKLTVFKMPVATFALVGAGTQCLSGNSFQFIPSDLNVIKHRWQFGNGDSSLLVSPTYSYPLAGSFQPMHIVTDSNQCIDSAYTSITVYSMPAKPAVTVNGNTITSGAPTGNQWYELTAGIIPGATSASFQAPALGRYYTIVTSPDGCSSSSDTLNFPALGIVRKTASLAGLNVFPNPSLNGTFRLKLEGAWDVQASVSLFDALGREVAIERQTTGSREISIRLQQPKSGSYMLKVYSPAGLAWLPVLIVGNE